jgi:tetracycline 7-halogenase / FADH2 O2-dependent halogenase
VNTAFHQDLNCDVCVIGSGFAGSLLAWILASRGRRVVIIDRSVHPRFAIGESSTPLADFLLERIADTYQLPELRPLSRWGSWQRVHPELRAGKKRGFSYFAHTPHQPFAESRAHEASLLVAASVSDELSDTHWMRCDVDQWLCQQSTAAGAELLEGFDIHRVEPHAEHWRITGRHVDRTLGLTCDRLVDASGGGGVVGQALGLKRFDDQLLTQTGALFGHFRHVGSMTEWLAQQHLEKQRLSSHSSEAAANPIETDDPPLPDDPFDDPFDADDAAQHHLLGQQGWMWMLRFSEGTTSVGIVQPAARWREAWGNVSEGASSQVARHAMWDSIVASYPTLADLLSRAELAGDSSSTAGLGWVPRIGRLWSEVAGVAGTRCGWAMLPGTAGIVDPLHSTGIAHGLYGVHRLAAVLLRAESSADLRPALADYSKQVVEEVQWIDRIVHCCYSALDDSFESFVAMCSLYFVAAIHSERQLHGDGRCTDGFLLKDSQPLQRVVAQAERRLRAGESTATLVRWLQEAIAPWNDVGLMDPQLRNRIARSTAPK